MPIKLQKIANTTNVGLFAVYFTIKISLFWKYMIDDTEYNPSI